MIRVVAAVIIEKDQIFLSSRPADKPPAGWEFPGGKVEPGENNADALKRELLEELNWQIVPGKELYILRHDNLEITFISAMPIPGSLPQCREGQMFKWVGLTPVPPENLLKNDLEFWEFLTSGKINM